MPEEPEKKKHAGGRPAGSGKPAAKHGAFHGKDRTEPRPPKKTLKKKPGEGGGGRA